MEKHSYAELHIYAPIRNGADLERVSKHLNDVNTRMASVSALPVVTRGTRVYTLPDEIRYRNDATYIWDGTRLVPLRSTDLDTYGMASPELSVRPGEPINLLSAPTHNSFWWPSPEQREALLSAPETRVTDTVSYRTIVSNGKTFRFYTDQESDLLYGPCSLDDEWESSDGDFNVNVEDEPDIIICSVCSAVDPDNDEVCYDEWDADEGDDEMEIPPYPGGNWTQDD